MEINILEEMRKLRMHHLEINHSFNYNITDGPRERYCYDAVLECKQHYYDKDKASTDIVHRLSAKTIDEGIAELLKRGNNIVKFLELTE